MLVFQQGNNFDYQKSGSAAALTDCAAALTDSIAFTCLKQYNIVRDVKNIYQTTHSKQKRGN